MRVLFFDTETTGLPENYSAPPHDSENWPRIVQLAWSLQKRGAAVEAPGFSGNYIVRPRGWEIPVESSAIHGITQERANNEGWPITAVLASFSKAVDAADLIVAHNLDFDRAIVAAEYYRAHQGMALWHLWHKEGFCTMKRSTHICQIPGPKGFKWPKLAELHEHLFNEGFDGAHDAANDIAATARCYWELTKQEVAA
jgi:DNA polymerase III subunit epsilon